MSDIYFIIPGQCVPKGRPRFTRNGRTYTPKKTHDYEKKVKECFLAEGFKPLSGALEIVVNVYFEIPKSASKKRQKEMLLEEYPTKRPDADNLLKSVADALNGVAYDDDSQIVVATVTKIWSESAKTEVVLREVRNGES